MYHTALSKENNLFLYYILNFLIYYYLLLFQLKISLINL